MVLPLLGEVAHNAYTSGAVASTNTTLVELELGANDAVAACPYTLPFDAHRAAVRTTLGPLDHLKGKQSHNYFPHFYFLHENRSNV